MDGALENIIKMSQAKKNQKLRLLSRVDLEIQLKIFQEQKPTFHRLKSVYIDVDNTVLTLASLIVAIDTVTKDFDTVNLNAIKLRGKNNKVKIKREKVLGYWAIVRTLRLEQNMSFRDMATYFAKYHKFEVSYSTIYELWNELEKNIKNKEN